MLAKIGHVLLDENKIAKYKKITLVLFFIGLTLFISFPLLCNRIFIVEKLLKHSETFNNQIQRTTFTDTSISFIEKFKTHDKQKPEDAIRGIFSEFDNISESFYMGCKTISVDITSQRGDGTKYLLINFIYDNENYYRNRNLMLMYTLLTHFSVRSNYNWLAMDIKVNFISTNDYYKNPSKILEMMENHENYISQKADFVINLDMLSDIGKISNFLFKLNGKDSECTDMDFYKVCYDNLNHFFPGKIKTNNKVFNTKTKIFIRNIVTNLGSVLKNIFPNNEISYELGFIYFLESIFDNFLLVTNKIDLNNHLISNHFNSLYIKIQEQNSHQDSNQLSIDTNFDEITIKNSFNFLLSLERILKSLNKSEIELFRGEMSYILAAENMFQGHGNFLLILVFCVIKIFYEILGHLFTINYKEAQPYKIVASLVFTLTTSFFVLLELPTCASILALDFTKTFYLLVVLVFVGIFFSVWVLKLTKDGLLLLDSILSFLIALNCFNVFFINHGAGLLMTVIFMSHEILLTKISKHKGAQVISLGLILYLIHLDHSFISNIVGNYVESFNNVYFILNLCQVHIAYRLSLVLLS